MKATTPPLVRTEELTKVYNAGRPDEVRAVDGVSMTVDRGEVVVLAGPSGSGKTSLLSLLGCMSRPTSGRIVVGNRDVAKLAEPALTAIRRSLFGFIFQQFNLIADVSVLENVMLPLYPVAMGFAAMTERADRILSDLGLTHRRGFKVRMLSGGEQQRVAIARALVNEPEILVADEPTAHLDQALSRELLEILEGLNRDGLTIVIATHDPLVSSHRAVRRVVEMRDGRVVAGSGR